MTEPTGRRVHRVALTPREALLFEAGIKLGGIFHQYLGIPVAARTARALERTIETAVGLQPYVAAVRVRLRLGRRARTRGRFSYRYVTAEMLDVRVLLRDGRHRVSARLSYRPELDYPLMRVEEVHPAAPTGRAARPPRRRRRLFRPTGSAR